MESRAHSSARRFFAANAKTKTAKATRSDKLLQRKRFLSKIGKRKDISISKRNEVDEKICNVGADCHVD